MGEWPCPLCGAPLLADVCNCWEDDWIGSLECDSGCFSIASRIYTSEGAALEAMEAFYRLLEEGARHIPATDLETINGGQKVPGIGGKHVY